MQRVKLIQILLLAAVGAVFATMGDAVHVRTRTLSYPDPKLFDQALWVYPGFFCVFLFMGLVYALAIPRLPVLLEARQSMSKGSWRECVETVAAFVFVYFVSGYGSEDHVLLSAMFYSAFAVRWAFTYDRAWLFILALAMALGGMAAEGAMSAAGLVTYRHSDVFNVPYWLGGLYLHGAFALREGMRIFVYGREEAR